MPNLLDKLDRFLDKLTSYRLVLYCLLAYVGWAVLGAALNQVAFKWYLVAASAAWLVAVCWLAGYFFSRLLKIPRNNESDYITALILCLILTPASTLRDFAILSAAGVVAVSSKYLLTIYRRHIFNPAALGAFAVGKLFDYFPSWWVGTKFLTPLVVVGGFLILRKMQRYRLVALFLLTYLAILAVNITRHQSTAFIGQNVWLALIATQLLFFATVMLIEPSTSPSVARKYLPCGALVAVLYGVTYLRISPEEALLLGNVLAFLVEPYKRLRLKLVRRQREAEGIFSFWFESSGQLNFQAGQYMEWTLPGYVNDVRGNRRYFTIASSPSEKEVMLAMRLPEPASLFKQRLRRLNLGDHILASRLAGDFVLPNNRQQKLAFLAGGIGITPFRSIVKQLSDREEPRQMDLFYSASKSSELAFKDTFEKAKSIGLRSHFVVGRRITAEVIKKDLPDYRQRRFYVSGPYSFIQATKATLLDLGVPRRQITTDYFPGYS